MQLHHSTAPENGPLPDDQIARALWPHLLAHPQASADGLDMIAVSDEIGEGRS